MTMIATTRPVNTRSNGFLAAMVSAVASWNDARVTRNALSRLSDRELNDIGLCRGDIELIARRS